MERLVVVLVALVAASISSPSFAQGAYPSKSIRMLLGFSAGGTSDALARDVAQALTTRLGHPVVVENRPGAGGNLANEAVARGATDGYTILFASSSIAIASAVYEKLGYDPLKDLAPISLVASAPNLLVVPANLPVRTVREFVDLARQKPGTVTYASAGNGSVAHLSGELLGLMANVKFQHVPYKGNAPATVDLIAGVVQANFNQINALAPLVKAGKLRALAVASKVRTPLLPDVPTMAEQGFPAFDLEPWFGMFAPAGTSQAIVDKLSAEVDAIVKSPDMSKRWELQGARAIGGSPDEFARRFREETARMGKLARDSGAKVD